MDLAHVLHRLWQLRIWMIWIAIASIVGAIALNYSVSLVPPRVENPKLQLAAASTQVLIDAPNSVVGDVQALVEPLAERAQVIAEFLETETVINTISRVSGVPAASISVEGQRGEAPVTASSEIRSSQIFAGTSRHRVFFRSERRSPIISIFTQAPTDAEALGLATGAARGVQKYVAELQERDRVPPASKVVVTRLGQPRGGYVNQGVDRIAVVATAVLLFVIGCVLLLALSGLIESLRKRRPVVPEGAASTD